MLGGIAIIARRRVLSPAVGWSALGVWIIALVGLSVTVVPIATDFREDARYSTTETLFIAGTPIFTLLNKSDNNHDRVRLSLLGHQDSTIQLKKTFEARGRNRERALNNAKTVSYELRQQDSTLTFPATYTFAEGSPFRDQEVDLTLYVPYGKPFLVDRDLSYILRKSILYRSGLSTSDLQDNTFRFTRQGLECMSCNEPENLDDQFREEADSTRNE